MNYFDYLNVKYTNTQLSFSLTNNFADDKYENPFKFDGKSIFTRATKQDLKKLDYKKLAELLNNAKGEDNKSGEEKEISPLEFLIREFLSLTKIKETVDVDNDGEITEQEVKDYVENLSQKDGKEDLSLEDFDKAIEESEINLEELSAQEKADNLHEQEQEFMTDSQSASAVINPQAVQNYSSTPVNPSNPFRNPSVPVSASQSQVHDTPAEMTLPQLIAEQSKRQKALKEAQSDYNSASGGDTNAVKTAKKAEAKAKDEYEKALKNDDAAKSIRKDIEKNNDAIDKNQKQTEKKSAEIAKKEADISKCDSNITLAQSELSAMESALASLDSAKQDDKDIASKKASLSKSIASKKKDIEKLQKQLKSLKAELQTLQDEKQKLEDEKKKLEEQKAQLDAKVNEECADSTKKALEVYNNAKKAAEEVKAKEIADAKTKLEESKKSLAEIDAKINVAKASEIKAKYSSAPAMDLSSVPADFRAQYGVSEKTLPDGTKVLACRWSRFSRCQKEWLDLQKPMLQAAKDLGLTLVYSDVERTVAESNAGRARKGALVCRGGESPHNYGVAADIVLFKDGRAVDVNSNLQTQFAQKAQAYSNNGVEWGGNWRKKGERHHFEVRGWRQKYKNAGNLVG